ncbi:MAG TPA: DUF5010 domain-containing protein [Mucilaginibacter sp.]|jgi:hypothetical protein|nr:DUF5010 domain-containing protein [Mucilaginibacter sp.]
MKKIYVCMACCVLLFAACSKKNDTVQNNTGNTTTNPTNPTDTTPKIPAGTQYLGVTMGYNNTARMGGLPNPSVSGNFLYNLPLYKAGGTEADWWDDMVEELEYSGVDYVAPVDRGYAPNSPNVDAGDPRKLVNLVAAMDRRGSNFKIAIFDDVPASWTASRNIDNGQGYGYDPKFDCSNTANYKYIWDYNIKVAFTSVPDARRFKILNRPVIIFWAAQPDWLVNYGNGNLKKILQYVRSQCQATFGFNPYIIVDASWTKNDSACYDPAVIDAIHNWFTMANPYTLFYFNDVRVGALCPGFRVVQGSTNMFIDANHGQQLIAGLNATKGSGAALTLVEGFTDAPENAALFRSKDATYYDYPNQRINILRRYSANPYPATLRVEAEACDSYNDLTTGNSGNTYRDGDIDVIKTTDTGGGWNVTDAQAGEWMEWKELPLTANTKFQIRYSATQASSVSFSVDGVALPAVNLPATGGTFATVDAGSQTLPANGLHTVRLTVVSGNIDINYFNRASF